MTNKTTQATSKSIANLTRLPALPKLGRARKAKTNLCGCGCGNLTASRFVPGHDSRLRGWAIRVERGLVALSSIPDGERQAVDAFLKANGGHVPTHGRTIVAPKPVDKKLAKRQARAAKKIAGELAGAHEEDAVAATA